MSANSVKIYIQIRNVIAPTEQHNNFLCYHIHVTAPSSLEEKLGGNAGPNIIITRQ